MAFLFGYVCVIAYFHGMENLIDKKQCTQCKKTYPATTDNFYRQKKGKFGLNAQCKKCRSAFHKEYMSTEEGKNKNKNIQSKWRELNPCKAKEYGKQNYLKNGSKHLENRRYRYKSDPEYKKVVLSWSSKQMDELSDSYIASSLNISVKLIPSDVLETRRLIIKLKRYLKDNGLKIH